jgi:hypothetical protein
MSTATLIVDNNSRLTRLYHKFIHPPTYHTHSLSRSLALSLSLSLARSHTHAHRPVWQKTYHHLARVGGLTPEFFALSVGVAGKFPWLQGRYTPTYVEVLDGNLVIQLMLRNGKRKSVVLDRSKCAVSSSSAATSDTARKGLKEGGGVEFVPTDACRAQFPTAALSGWQIAAPLRGPVFFALAWDDASEGRNGDRFQFLD